MKKTGLISLLVLMVMVLTTLTLPFAALAQEEEPGATDNTTNGPPEPELISEETPEPEPISEEPPEPEPIVEEEEKPATMTISTEFPKLEAVATGSFEFNVKLEYLGKGDRTFDLNTTIPSGWDAYINPQYESKRIPSIVIPAAEYVANSKNIKINVTPPTWPLAEPGDYTITIEAVSGEVVGTFDLTAIITAKYVLSAAPVNEVYNTKAKAGRDNIYSLEVANFGTDDMTNITFTSQKPSGWEITFEPEKLDVLEIFEPQTVDVNIKPPPKTVAGDYMITLRVSGEEANADKISVRVTVETPTIWGWVGVAIIIIVIVGLVVIFMRLGRR